MRDVSAHGYVRRATQRPGLMSKAMTLGREVLVNVVNFVNVENPGPEGKRHAPSAQQAQGVSRRYRSQVQRSREIRWRIWSYYHFSKGIVSGAGDVTTMGSAQRPVDSSGQ